MIMKKYQIIYADPPWPYSANRPFGSTKEHRPNSYDNHRSSPSAKKRYGSMSLEDIEALKVPSADNAHLYLWTTNSFIGEALGVAKAWGFKPKTVLTWVKVKPDGNPSMKMGYYFRGATEHIVFAVKGKLRIKKRNIPTAFLLPREMKHSKKPDFFRKLIEENSDGPRLELFARQKVEGWDAWGNEVENDINLTPSNKVYKRL